MEIPQGKNDAEGQPALENAARAGHPDELSGILHIIAEVADEEDQLGADQGHDHDIESGVEEAGRIQPLLPGLAVEKPEAQGHADGHHEPIGMNGQGAELDENGFHAVLLTKKM